MILISNSSHFHPILIRPLSVNFTILYTIFTLIHCLTRLIAYPRVTPIIILLHSHQIAFIYWHLGEVNRGGTVTYNNHYSNQVRSSCVWLQDLSINYIYKARTPAQLADLKQTYSIIWHISNTHIDCPSHHSNSHIIYLNSHIHAWLTQMSTIINRFTTTFRGVTYVRTYHHYQFPLAINRLWYILL